MFTNNQQISHRQLFRQIVMTFMGVYLLCLPGWEMLEGRRGMICTGIGVLLLLFYSIFLIRISYVFHNMEKSFGKIGSKIVAFVYLTYLLATGIFLSVQIEQIVSRFLVEGVRAWVVVLLIVISCYLGSHQGLERRGRMAEVCFPLVAGALFLLFFLAIFKVNPEYLKEYAPIEYKSVLRGSYGIFCAFAPLLLLPFTLKRVEKPGSARGVIIGAIFFLASILGIAFLLLQGTFGLKGIYAHRFPMIGLMAGVDLPGDFLQRVDVFWIIFIVFSLLFALGSVFFYSHEVLERVNWEKGQGVIGLGVFFGTMFALTEEIPKGYYGWLLEYVYIPLLLIVCIIAGMRFRRRK